jgi:tetratricopeptide (TPR) repeat protein
VNPNIKIQRALAFCQQGQFTRAEQVCREIVNSRPNNTDALHILGLVALETQNFTGAVELLSRVVKIDPRYATAFVNRGSAFQALGQWEAALESYAQALALDANLAEAHYNCGVVLQKLQRREEALARYDTTIALRPDLADVYFNRALVLHELKHLPAALASYDQALALEPGLAAAARGRANALYELGRLNEALAAFDRTISLTPEDALAHCNRGNVLRELRQLDAALASYERAIALQGALAVAHCNRANVLSELNKWDLALAGYDQAIALNPDYAEAYFNKAMTQLLIEDFENGWVNYEWRLKLKRTPTQNVTDEARFRERRWNGKDSIAGKKILVRSEQGYGDNIQFCRYVAVLAGLGGQVLLEVQRPLLKLLQPLQGASQVLEPGTPVEFDYQIPLLSLPLAFDTKLGTIPSATRYLASDPAKVAAWESKLGTKVRPRVGLVWRGKLQRGDNRSAELSELAGCLPAGFQYVSLQKEISKIDTVVLETKEIINCSAEQHDFSDTAALCDCMDVVISIDTSIAHLSGALGKRTWILLPIYPDWRWSRSGADCPWYPTARLYRQSSANAWGEVYTRVLADLASAFGTSTSQP